MGLIFIWDDQNSCKRKLINSFIFVKNIILVETGLNRFTIADKLYLIQ